MVLFILKALWGVVSVTSCCANDIKRLVPPSPPGTPKFPSIPDNADTLSTRSAEQQYFNRNKLRKPGSEITDLHFTKKPVLTPAFANKFLLICQDSCWSYCVLRQAATPLPSSPLLPQNSPCRACSGKGPDLQLQGAAMLMGYLQSLFMSWQGLPGRPVVAGTWREDISSHVLTWH